MKTDNERALYDLQNSISYWIGRSISAKLALQ